MPPDRLLDTRTAAQALGITVPTLYGWLSASDAGTFVLRSAQVTIENLQGGPRGQGRIRLPTSEILRLRDLMKVQPHRRPQPTRSNGASLQHISTLLGRPDDEP